MLTLLAGARAQLFKGRIVNEVFAFVAEDEAIVGLDGCNGDVSGDS